jgi:RNA recognition motif-containing protein
MASLLGSIFGGENTVKSVQDPAAVGTPTSLFEKSETLPDRPQHKPVARRKRKPEQQVPDTSQEIAPLVQEKKKRKSKKPKSGTDAEAKTTVGDELKTEQKRSGDDKAEAANIGEIHSETDGVDDNKKSSEEERTVFVGNLPLASTRKSLTSIFKECGPIASARIRSVPVKGIKLPQSRAGDQRFMKKVCVNTHQVDEDSYKNSVQGYVVFRTLWKETTWQSMV